jgi:hypothetical protein
MLPLLLVAFQMGLWSCRKQAGGAENTASSSLLGTWELRQAQGGMTPSLSYAPGNGNRLVFSDARYAVYKNGSLAKRGQYILIADSSVEAAVGLVVPVGQFFRRILYDQDSTAPKTFLEVSGNRLRLLSGYFPLDSGSDEVYERESSDAHVP